MLTAGYDFFARGQYVTAQMGQVGYYGQLLFYPPVYGIDLSFDDKYGYSNPNHNQ
jgi:hypothetical protein